MQNTLYTHDNLYVLNGVNSEIADLIYLDPPFNSKRMYSAPVGTKAAGSSFKDMWSWEDVDESYLETLAETHPELTQYIASIGKMHSKEMMAYILYMSQRLIQLHRILKSTGSLYLHCDPTASHYLKLALDGIFGKKNFKNEIVWAYQTGGVSKKWFGRKHDIILFYAKDTDNNHIDLSQVKDRRSEKSLHRAKNAKGSRIDASDTTKIPTDVWNISALNAMASERTGYPTQKPLELLHRIIKASCPESGLVLDPFCGCATTCVAAQQLGRKWIGIDIETKAVDILIQRLEGDGFIDDSQTIGLKFKKKDVDFIHLTKPQQRTDVVIEEITHQTKNDIKKRLFKQQEGHCNGCNVELEIQHFEIDHVIPKAKGGGDYMENYQLLCGNCNRTKGAKPMEYLRMKIETRLKMAKHRITFGDN